MTLPIRKPNRLSNFDYAKPGAYFITICSKDKQWLFWKVGASIARPHDTGCLSHYGKIIEQKIGEIPKHYKNVNIDNYVIMPNHIHLLLSHYYDDSGRAMLAPTPTISKIIQQFKGAVTKDIHQSVWQKSFHDRIIRNEKDYLKIYEYIDNNPLKWEEDCFYIST